MFIAIKPCSFAGQTFYKGSAIPGGLVQPQAISRLINGGFIAEADEAGSLLPASTSIDETVEVPILTEDGEEHLAMTVEDILMCIRMVQLPLDELKAKIATIESADALILIDSLKTGIHDEAKARAKELSGEAMEYPKTEKELMALKRDELVEIAAKLGMKVTDTDTKQVLTTYILDVTGNE